MVLVYRNHNANNLSYQTIGGSWSTVMGYYVINTWVLKLTRVFQELLIIQEYASDILILRLESVKTIGKINMFE